MKAPNVNLSGTGILALAGLAALGLVGAWVYSNRKTIASAAERTLATVNPADDRNAAYSAVSAVGEAVTGRSGWTLGGAIADLFPSQAERELQRQWSQPLTVDQAIMDANDARARSAPGTGAGTVVPWDMPLDPNDSSTWAAP